MKCWWPVVGDGVGEDGEGVVGEVAGMKATAPNDRDEAAVREGVVGGSVGMHSAMR